MHDITKWLINWFAQHSNVDKSSLNNPSVTSENYFEQGLIDSFSIILLIEEIETTFKVSLSQAHFEQRRFATINGLAEIIQEERQ